MKRLACILILVFAAAFATGCGSSSSSSSSAATVNGTDIDRADFLDQLGQLSKLNGGDANSATASQSSGLLTSRIIAVLVSDEMARLGLKVTDADLETARTEVGEVPEGITQSFVDYVVRAQAEQDVLVARINDSTQPWFTDAEVQSYYDFVKDTKFVNYCTHHILVDDEATANEILASLKNGGDFAQLAKDRSTDTASAEKGGDLGCNTKGSFVPEFEAAVFDAHTGDTLGPVKSEYGYHIIRVDHEYGPQTFAEVRDSIATTLSDEQGWLTWKSYSSKIDVDKKYGTWSKSDAQVIPPADPTKPTTPTTK